ncbi:MAG: TIM barrel protein [Planctomycetota bacterium]
MFDRRGFIVGAGSLLGLAGNVAAADKSRKGASATKTDDSTPKTGTTTDRLFLPGTVTYNIAKDWDLETLIKNCEQVGLAAVELRTTHKHGVEPSLDASARKKVRDRFEDTPVKLFGLGTTCEFHSPDAATVKKNIATATDFIRLAHDVGADGIKVRPNGLAKEKGIPVDATLTQIGHALAECGKASEPFGIEIWLEVHGKETSKPEYIRKILDACGHPNVGITWNSNDSDVEDGSIGKAFDLLGPNIRCVHVRDLFVDYPFEELFLRLRQQGYDRYTMAEIPESSDPIRVLRYFRELWEQLSKPA